MRKGARCEVAKNYSTSSSNKVRLTLPASGDLLFQGGWGDLREIKNSSQARQEPDLNEKPVSRFFVPPTEKKLSQKTF